MNKQDFIKRLSEQQPEKITKNDYSALPEALDVYREFNVPLNTLVEDLEETAVKLTEGLTVLF